MPLNNVLNATLCNTGQYIYGCHLLKCINLSDSLFYDLPLSIMEINSKMLTVNLICLLYKISKIQMTRRKGGWGAGVVTLGPPPRLRGRPYPLLHLNPPLQSFYSGCGSGDRLGFLLHRFTQYNGEVQYACTLWKTSLHHLLKQELLEITNKNHFIF